jgi:sulfotransferase
MTLSPAKQLIMLGGLPRSGSTLLCNILAQNPSVHATSSSGCVDLLFGLRNHWDRLIEHQTNPDRQENQQTKLCVLGAVLQAYHSRIQKPIVVDKSRSWIALLEVAEAALGQKAKVLVPVRNVADVLASFEKLHRRQSAIGQTPGEADNYHQFQTVEGRCEYWMRPDQQAGLAFNRVRDALARGFADRLHFVEFADLTARPKESLDAIYAFLGVEPFTHNFQHVDQVTQEVDALHGFEGLHSIRKKVEPIPSDWRRILGPAGERYASLSSVWKTHVKPLH